MSIKPNFLIIGAAKAGTTSLCNYLNQHPQVFMSPNKEPHFFSLEGETDTYKGPGDERGFNYRVKEWPEYLNLFRNSGDYIARGEASTHYLYQTQAAERIYQRIPTMKLIVILRDPTQAAYSAFLHMYREGREPVSDFSLALEQEQFRIENNWAPLWHYTKQWYYAKQLKHFQIFFPKSQMRVFLYEDLQKRPEWLMQEISAFLDVSSEFLPDFTVRYNQSGKPRFQALHNFLTKGGKTIKTARLFMPKSVRKVVKARIIEGNLQKQGLPPMLPETEIKLRCKFESEVLDLEKIIGRDLSSWRVKN